MRSNQVVRQASYYLITVSPLPYILSQQAHLIHRFLLFKQLVYADFLSFPFLVFSWLFFIPHHSNHLMEPRLLQRSAFPHTSAL